MNYFKGKVAFVTGATSGIGRATAIAFGKNGATVVVTGRREKEGRETLDMVRTAGGDGTFMRLDVAVESEVAGVIREIVSRHGRLDCAVNCAGYDVAHALTEFSEADYDAIFNANVKGLFFCLKHEILAMRGKGGAIVNVGSVAAQMSDLGNSLYNASKAAAHSLNRTAATEAAKNGIRVNEVAPGPTKTPMLEGFPPAPPQMPGPRSIPHRSWRTSRSAALEHRTSSPMRCCFSVPTRRRSLPAPASPSMAASCSARARA